MPNTLSLLKRTPLAKNISTKWYGITNPISQLKKFNKSRSHSTISFQEGIGTLPRLATPYELLKNVFISFMNTSLSSISSYFDAIKKQVTENTESTFSLID
jgi:hypothetical protein